MSNLNQETVAVDNVAAELHRPQVKMARLSEEVQLPKQAHDTDAGFDLHSTTRVDIPPGGSMLVGTGLLMEIPEGWCGQINPRSGMASKHKVLVGARIIDSGFRSEVMINLINHGPEIFEVTKGIADLAFSYFEVKVSLATKDEELLNSLNRTRKMLNIERSLEWQVSLDKMKNA